MSGQITHSDIVFGCRIFDPSPHVDIFRRRPVPAAETRQIYQETSIFTYMNMIVHIGGMNNNNNKNEERQKIRINTWITLPNRRIHFPLPGMPTRDSLTSGTWPRSSCLRRWSAWPKKTRERKSDRTCTWRIFHLLRFDFRSTVCGHGVGMVIFFM